MEENLKHSSAGFDVVSNPEFLREGNAVHDFMSPERIVIGTDNPEAAEKIKKLYKSFDVPVLISDIRSAEMAKYACNSYLASRISFINEIAEICEKVGADINSVTRVMKLDKRIGRDYLSPGPGFGGPCLSKDLKSLINFAQRADANVNMLKSVSDRNDMQIDNLTDYICKETSGSGNAKISVLGLSFKAGTGDIRNSPAVYLLEKLVSTGISVTAFDPVVKQLDNRFNYNVTLAGTIEDAVRNSDCLVIMTDWQEFKELSLEKIKDIMRTPSIVDARNIISATDAYNHGFRYKGIGTGSLVLDEHDRRYDLRQIV